MNEAEQIPQQDAIDVRQLALAIRFTLVSIVLGLSYVSLQSSLSIGTFRLIFADMLGDRPLPTLTQFVLGARPLFVAVSVIVPIVAIATLFLRGLVGSFYIIGVFGLVAIAQFITLYHGLSAPIFEILRLMREG